MKFYVQLLACCALALACWQWTTVAAGRVALRPLSVRELRQALREYNEPAGRSISPALAAIKGLALGITKGVGGSLIYDVITSNATLAYLSSLTNTSSTSGGTAQEICFTSRSVDGGDALQGRAAPAIIDDNDDDVEEGRQVSTTGSTLGTTGTGTGITTGTGTGTTTSTGNGITCIVVNSNGGNARRHRRSVNSQQQAEQAEQPDQAEYKRERRRTKLRSKKARKMRKLHKL